MLNHKMKYFLLAGALTTLSFCTKNEPAVTTETAPNADAGMVTDAQKTAAPAQEIVIEAQTIDGAVHWTPAVVEVKAGTNVRFTVKHELVGGFDFHGFSIPELGVAKQVNRNQPQSFEVLIPADKAGQEIAIGCQFHPKHVGNKIVVL